MADGSEQVIQASAGSTVADVLAQAGVQLSALDRTEPALTTILQENTAISIIRVKESFEVVERELPFEQITVRNETLTAGQQLLVQAGSNGLEEITYRVLTENGKETSRMVAASRVLQEPKPEIIMVGVHSLAQSTDLPGRLAFLAGGSAWMLEGSTGNRQPLILTGDLDGRVFELSEDGSWLLYTRAGSTPDTINTLWAAEITA
ncbi:MAG TPA: G5 domain-containing protein, partial [Anaerolineaceae bacterium]|nr:G5 domain-containing protein [Anaerolineaceae bacterium]